MKVLVCVISSQDSIAETIKRQRDRLIPQDIFKNKKMPDYPVNFKVSLYNPQEGSTRIEEFLLHNSRNMDAVILLVESKYSHLIASVANAVFAAIFEIPEDRVENFKNFFGSYFSQLFRNFIFVKTLMSDTEKEQAMMLPLRNFKAPEMQEMARLTREESRSSRFTLEIEARLSDIVKRRLPRRRSNGRTKYFVDDKGMHFAYGNEKHARFDTGNPHIAACEFNGHFRFGKRIDPSRHYNASFGEGDDTNISGEFPDCHDQMKTISKSNQKTHLNMFANDFY